MKKKLLQMIIALLILLFTPSCFSKSILADKNGKTSLMLAVENKQENRVKTLLDRGVKTTNEDGRLSPLHIAAYDGTITIAKMLVSKGAKVDCRDYYACTPLHKAAYKGNIEMVQFLIDNGADINAKNASKVTPLHYACSNGKYETVKYLLSKGADVNARDEDGQTPLMCVSGEDKMNYNRIAKTLISQKAEINITDKDGNTPLQKADSAGNNELADLYRKLGSVK
jgi:cytohesin